MLRHFDIVPDADLDLMKPDQSLAAVAAAILENMPAVLRTMRPDIVVVQGDTTSAFAAGLAAFYAGIDVAHVEAGLRSGDVRAPWPEEVNRRLLSVVTRFHFAPTEEARANLLREGTDPAHVHVTGNTVIDALLIRWTASPPRSLRTHSFGLSFLDVRRHLILVTDTPREFRCGFESIATRWRRSREHEDVEIVYPVPSSERARARAPHSRQRALII